MTSASDMRWTGAVTSGEPAVRGILASMKARVISLVAVLACTVVACGKEALVFPDESQAATGDAAAPDAKIDAAGADGGPSDAGSSDGAGEPACVSSGLSTCAGACVDSQSDPAHCGACGTVCSQAKPFCQAGQCVSMCSGNLTACGSACVNLGNAAANCGACGAACPASAVCANARCICTQGRDVCGGVCVDTKNDVLNCGACGTKCAAQEVCAAGRCK